MKNKDAEPGDHGTNLPEERSFRHVAARFPLTYQPPAQRSITGDGQEMMLVVDGELLAEKVNHRDDGGTQRG